MTALATLEVLALDCQASGATPVHGEMLELGWWIGRSEATRIPTRAYWTQLERSRTVPLAIRKLTGWEPACLDEARSRIEVWRALLDDLGPPDGGRPMPTVIHYARFERPFLDELHARASEAVAPGSAASFPLDPICLHAVGARLFPDLPRRNLRALAGHLGFSPDLVRRAHGHVEATAFLWRALVPRLAELGIDSWDRLKDWLDAVPVPSSRGRKRGFPLSAERRRALPDGPGVYRFLRPNGDVLYVGKATSLRKRVSSHFTAGGKTTERALEMLSQVHDVAFELTGSPLEAALHEADEIKRFDPPYNVHLRSGERSAWFASTDWSSTRSTPDDDHRVGPLPSARSLAGIAAIRQLLEGSASVADPAVRAAAVGAPPAFAPERAVFEEAFGPFAAEELGGSRPARARILEAAGFLVVVDETSEEPGWDPARVRRHLERVVVSEGSLVRRARLLGLLSTSCVRFTEVGGAERTLVLRGAEIRAEDDAPAERPPSRHARLAVFDAARYDRLRVLATELQRIATDGGRASFRVGDHVVAFGRRRT